MVAIIAFPAAILSAAAIIAIFYAAPLLLFVPFLLNILIFLGGHFAWTVMARFCASWAGLGAYTRQMSFMAGYWGALGLAAVLYVGHYVLGWAIETAVFRWSVSAAPETMFWVSAFIEDIGTPLGYGLYLTLMAVVLVPRVIGLSVRDRRAYSEFSLLARFLVILPMATGLTWVVQVPLVDLLTIMWELGASRYEGSEDLPDILSLLSVPVFLTGVTIWLSAAILVSFEAHFLVRL